MKEFDDFKDPCEVVAKILFLMGGETLEDTDTELRKFKCARIMRELSQLRNGFIDDVFEEWDWVHGTLNRIMDDCIDDCAKLFPNVKWDYIRDLFVVPGVTDEQVDETLAKGAFTADGYLYWPDMPWKWEELISGDEDFLRALYLKNRDSFFPSEKLPMDAPESVQTVHGFLAGARKAAMFVDCGKTDPFRFVSFLEALPDTDAAKLGPIRLFCDENTSPTWEHLRSCVLVPVEYIYEPLTAEVCGKYASGTVLLAAGDNTAALAAQLPNKKTIALLTDPDLAIDSPTSVVLEDDAHSTAVYELKHAAIKKQVLLRINTIVDEKLEEILSESIKVTGARLTDDERKMFLRK